MGKAKGDSGLLPPERLTLPEVDEIEARMKAEQRHWYPVTHQAFTDIKRLIAHVRADSQPVPAGQDEVEKALAELREMFPQTYVKVHRNEQVHRDANGSGQSDIYTKIEVGNKSPRRFVVSSTLAEAMQKVREWKEKQR